MVRLFTRSLKIVQYLISGLTNLSASNDLSVHFQGHIQERYSRVPEN